MGNREGTSFRDAALTSLNGRHLIAFTKASGRGRIVQYFTDTTIDNTPVNRRRCKLSFAKKYQNMIYRQEFNTAHIVYTWGGLYDLFRVKC